MTGTARPTRVLIVDDSAVMRSVLRSVVAGDPGLEVAGTAADGATALQSIAMLEPDVVLLDVEMPVMDGLTTLKRLRAQNSRVPVIMVSSLTQRGARVTIEALASGAADYAAKPEGQFGREPAIRALAAELRPKIHALRRKAARTGEGTRAGIAVAPRPRATALQAPAVVAIGVSTGGPAALEEILPRLPATFPVPVLVVQHMPEVFTALLAERLDKACMLRVAEARDGEPLVPGRVVIARGGYHLEVARGSAGERVIARLTQGPEEHHCRPSVDVLFRSVARVYGGKVLGVMLTGMGSDGLAGCRMLRELGAAILAQDEASSAVWGMPGAVAAEGLADRVLPLGQMAREIESVASAPARWGALREAAR